MFDTALMIPKSRRNSAAIHDRRAGWLGFVAIWACCSTCVADEMRTVHDAVEQTVDLTVVEDRSDSERDGDGSSRSAALFAHGHLLKRQGQHAQALSAFQRAWFWYPQHRKVLDEIVSLAFMLDRDESAVQYAVLAAELEPRDPNLVRQLADILLQKGEYVRAASLFQSGLALLEQGDTPVALTAAERDALRFQLQTDLAKACFLGDVADEGVVAVTTVIRSLQSQIEDTDDDTLRAGIRREIALFWDMLGELQRQRGAYDEARHAFEQAWKVDQEMSTWLYWQARLAFEQQDLATAREALDEYLELTVRAAGFSALELLGELYADERDRLHQRLEAKFAEDPTDRALGFYLAESYLQQEEAVAAQGILETLFHDGPSLDAYRNLLQCYRLNGDAAAVIALLGKLAEAEMDLVAVAEEVEEIVKDQALLRRIVEFGMARSDDEARPLLAREAFAIALVLSQAEAWEPAENFMRMALNRARPEEQIPLSTAWAIECLLLEQYDRAVHQFEQILNTNGEPASRGDHQFYLATALALGGQPAAALAVIEKAIAEDPESIALASRRPWILRIDDRPDEAITAYQQLVARFADEEISDELQAARISLAALAADQGHVALAEKHLLDVIAHDPDNYGAMNDLGYLWADHAIHLQRAQALIEMAVAHDPENAAYLDSRGWVHFRLGDLTRAIADLERAAELSDPADGVIFDHLGDAYAAAGRAEEARKAWKDAIEAFRDAKELGKIEAVQGKIQEPTASR